jgi:hypothetical protein
MKPGFAISWSIAVPLALQAQGASHAGGFAGYWAFLPPGIVLIRLAAVTAPTSDVERQGRRSAAAPQGGRV